MFEGCVLETAADSFLARELLQKGPGAKKMMIRCPMSCRLKSGRAMSLQGITLSCGRPLRAHRKLDRLRTRPAVLSREITLSCGPLLRARRQRPWRRKTLASRQAFFRSRCCLSMCYASVYDRFGFLWGRHVSCVFAQIAGRRLGHLVSCIVGLNDASNERKKWLRMCRDVEGLCRWKPHQHDTDAHHVLRNRAANEILAEPSAMGGDSGLLGREGAHEREVLRRVKRVQSLAAGGVERERMAQAEMFETRPQKLVAQDTPMSMFQTATWAMAFPDLLTACLSLRGRLPCMEAAEVFRYLLLREELVYSPRGQPLDIPFARWSRSVFRQT